MPDLNQKRIAEAMAKTAASYVMIAPKGGARRGTARVCGGIPTALADFGIAASAEDVVYHIKLVTNVVQNMAQPEVEQPSTLPRSSLALARRCCARPD
jgi:hypothetical protein